MIPAQNVRGCQGTEGKTRLMRYTVVSNVRSIDRFFDIAIYRNCDTTELSIRYSTLSIVDDDGHVAGIDGDALLLHQRSLLA